MNCTPQIEDREGRESGQKDGSLRDVIKVRGNLSNPVTLPKVWMKIRLQIPNNQMQYADLA
jgi:hypothetical protein